MKEIEHTVDSKDWLAFYGAWNMEQRTRAK